MEEIKFYISRSGDSRDSRLGWSQWGEPRHGDSSQPGSDDANLGVLGASNLIWWAVLKRRVPVCDKCAQVSHGFTQESFLTAGSSARPQSQLVCGSISSAAGGSTLVCQAAAQPGRPHQWAGQEEITGRLSQLSQLGYRDQHTPHSSLPPTLHSTRCILGLAKPVTPGLPGLFLGDNAVRCSLYRQTGKVIFSSGELLVGWEDWVRVS